MKAMLSKTVILIFTAILISAMSYIGWCIYSKICVAIASDSAAIMNKYTYSVIKSKYDINENMCVMPLQLMKCCLFDNELSYIRRIYCLPEEKGERNALISDIDALQRYYSRNVGELQYAYECFLINNGEYQDAVKNAYFINVSGENKGGIIDYIRLHSNMCSDEEVLEHMLQRYDSVSSISFAKVSTKWKTPFGETMNGIFKPASGPSVECKYMCKTDNVKYINDSNRKVIYMKTASEEIGFYIYVPTGDVSMSECVKNIDEREMFICIRNMNQGEVFLKMPMLDFNATIEILQIDENGEEKIIQQSTHMIADTNGARAESSTVLGDGYTLYFPETIIIDSPFIFAIVDEVRMIVMCIGFVSNPLGSVKKNGDNYEPDAIH